jgi:hypothetical protein
MPMKAFLLAAIVAVLGIRAASQSDLGTIEGRVLESGTSAPIPGAQITLIHSYSSAATLTADDATQIEAAAFDIAVNNGSASAADAIAARVEERLGLMPGTLAKLSAGVVVTDGAGHFSFGNLPPGHYAVRARHDGYFGPLVNGSHYIAVSITTTIDAGNPTPEVTLVLDKGAAISGRVRDIQGQPAPGMQVAAYTLFQYVSGAPRWAPFRSNATTDDHGDYRLFGLPSGTYYLGVTSPGTDLTWLRTFFPV